MIVLFSYGCGLKAPPRPPFYIYPPKINDLRHTVQKNILSLSWTVPEFSHGKKAKIANFIVYRAKNPTSSLSICKKCPILFKELKKIPFYEKNLSPGQKHEITYMDTLKKGYRYVYKVTIYTTQGIESKGSNHVDFTH